MIGFRSTNQFKRHYKRWITRNEPLRQMFLETPVGDHPLAGLMSGERAFWINEDYRVIYVEKSDCVLLLDTCIGWCHGQ